MNWINIKQFICYYYNTNDFEKANPQFLTTLKILIPLSHYDLVALTLLHYLKKQIILLNSQLVLTIALLSLIKKSSNEYMHVMIRSWFSQNKERKMNANKVKKEN